MKREGLPVDGEIVVASVSGGKDSTAMCLYLKEMGIPFRAVHMLTGWDHPVTVAYVRETLPRVLGVPVEEIGYPGGMLALVRAKKMFPARTIRFCTEELKVKPMKRLIASIVESGFDVVNAVGIRREESASRADTQEWVETEWADSWTWAPIAGWSVQDVIDIHHRHGVKPNPLYLVGAERVGCWPCIFSRKSEIRMMADIDPARIDELEALEAEFTQGAQERATRDGREKTASENRAWFQGPSGSGMVVPIRKVVEWSKTSRGGRQFELFASAPRDAGCMRWGLCDTGKGFDV